jgi:hypothetical protein
MLVDTNGNELGVLDILNILSFLIGLVNLDSNLSQSDKQDLMQEVDNKTQDLLTKINKHLENQDSKLNEILLRLEKLEK